MKWYSVCSTQIRLKDHRSAMDMSVRFKLITFIISATVLTTILAGPPLAFAVNLPTICNVFHKKHSMDKSGHCGSQTLLSKLQAKSFEGGIVDVFPAASAIVISAVSQDNHSLSLLPSTTPPQFIPLRC
jgi:hypothetical protein